MMYMPCPAAAGDSEAILIQLALAGHQDAFGDLLLPHMLQLSRLVRSRMRNDTDAEDIVQQVILKAFEGLKQFRFEASFRTWLLRIAINEVMQWHRKRARSRLLPLEESSLTGAQAGGKAPSPLLECERQETSRRLQRTLARLPEHDRAVIHLLDFEDRSIAEAAQLLRLTVPAVKTRHRRARLRMVRLFATCARPDGYKHCW